MKKIIWAFLAFALISVPARADKWATATFHTNQPIDQVFEPTAKLIASKEWYFGTRWHIRSTNRALGTIQAATVSFGQQWGDIYVSIATEGTGTSIQAVMTLYSGAHLHPADYALRFAKGLKKVFPDLTYDIKRDAVPGNFALGVGQVSIPLVAAAPVVQPMQNPTVNQGTTVNQEPMPLVSVTAPAVRLMQSSVANQGTMPISPAQVNSINNSLQQIAASSSQKTVSMPATITVSQRQSDAPTVPNIFVPTVTQEPIRIVPYTAAGVVPMQSSVANQGAMPISPAQIYSIDNSLQNIAASLTQRTVSMPATIPVSRQQNYAPTVPNMFVPTAVVQPTPMVPYTATIVQPMQNFAPNQMQQNGQALQSLGNSLMTMADEMSIQASIQAARNKQRVDEATTGNAVTQFLSNANQAMSRYLATSGSEAAVQFESTAQVITKARDDAYIALTDPTEKDLFNRATNEYMLAFGKQMGDHVSQQTSANRQRQIDEEQYTDNLHRALDSWYANGKEWHKIPPETWNKLSERDKGRLEDGIDPETINIRTPHPDHSPQP